MIGFCMAAGVAVVEEVALVVEDEGEDAEQEENAEEEDAEEDEDEGEEEVWLLTVLGTERNGAAKRCQTCVALKGKRNSIVEPA